MLHRTLLAATLLAAATTLAAHAQSGTFELIAGGKSVGKSTYTIKKNKSGYVMSNRYGTSIRGNDVDVADEFKYDENYVYQDGSSASISSQSRGSFTPNKARNDMTIGNFHGGVQEASQLPIKPDFTVLPTFDAGACQAFLLEAITHPSAKGQYDIVVPANAAAGVVASDDTDPTDVATRGQQARSGNNAYDAQFQKRGDATGTLDGKPVTLHTYTLGAGGGKFTWTFYADDSNTLMEVDNTMNGSKYVRAKFKLDATAAK